jgi:polyisoprenoid-binding protein YceI
MKLVRKVLLICVKNVVGLAVIVMLVIALSFLPAVVHVKAGVERPEYTGLQMQPLELTKQWKVLDGSAVYVTVNTNGEDVNYKFTGVQGSWNMNTKHPEQMQAEMKVKTQSLDSGNSLRDMAVKGSSYLDVSQFPEATFQLKSFGQWPDQWNERDTRSFRMNGLLTIKGVSKEVSFDCQGKYDNGQFLMSGNTNVEFSSYHITNPHNMLFHAEDEVMITLQILLGPQEESSYVAPGEKPTRIDFQHPDPKLTHYIVDMDVDTKQKRVTGTMEVHTRNTASTPLDRIYFHLYPNQFRNEQTLTGKDWATILGTSSFPGWIDVKNVMVDGERKLSDTKGTLLEIPLQKWAVGQEITVKFQFDLTLPKNNGRASFDNDEIWMGNALPIQAVYDQNGWNVDPYFPYGDPFYSETANYDVHVTLPKDYKLASTGVDQRIGEKNGKAEYAIAADQVRDLALVAMDNQYAEASEWVGDVKVNTWYQVSDYKGYVQKLHDAAVNSFRFYNQHFGTYPYKEYDVVQTGGFFGGMEYPGLVLIQNAYFQYDIPRGPAVVAHETGHQWWYAMVGNNEVKEPWLDEALTEYSTIRFFESYDPIYAKDDIERRRKAVALLGAAEKSGEAIGNGLGQFPVSADYYSLVYTKGSLMFYDLGKSIGDAKMDQVLQSYFNTYEYRVAHSADLERAFMQVAGPRVQPYFDAWLHGGSATLAK